LKSKHFFCKIYFVIHIQHIPFVLFGLKIIRGLWVFSTLLPVLYQGTLWVCQGATKFIVEPIFNATLLNHTIALKSFKKSFNLQKQRPLVYIE